MLTKMLMIIIGSVSITILISVAIIWIGTFLENVDLTDIQNLIDEIADHAERIAKNVNAMTRESKDGEDIPSETE